MFIVLNLIQDLLHYFRIPKKFKLYLYLTVRIYPKKKKYQREFALTMAQ